MTDHSHIEPPHDIFDWFGGYLEGEFDIDDGWVASGFESEADHPDKYEHDGKRWWRKEQ